MKKITLKMVELSLDATSSINILKYIFVQAPSLNKVGELTFSTTKDKGNLFFQGSQKQRKNIFEKGTNCGEGYLGDYILKVKKLDNHLIYFSCDKWTGIIERIAHNIYMINFAHVHIKIIVDNYSHKANIQFEGEECSYAVPMTLTPNNPLMLFQNILNILTFGFIKRNSYFRLIPSNYQGCHVSKLGIILSVTILRLVHYDADFSNDWN